MRQAVERDALAGILPIDADRAAIRQWVAGKIAGAGIRDIDRQPPPLRHGLQRIAQDMREHLFQSDHIALQLARDAEILFDGDHRQLRLVGSCFLAKRGDPEHLFLGEIGRAAANAGVEQFLRIDFFVRQHQRAGKERQVLDQQIHAVHFAGHDVPKLRAKLRIVRAFWQQLGVTLDGDDGVLEFVRQPRRQPRKERLVSQFAFVGLLELHLRPVFEQRHRDQAVGIPKAHCKAGGTHADGPLVARQTDFVLP